VDAPTAAVPANVELYFDTGSTAPEATTGIQLTEIADYAKANPSARVSVSGYHSPSGDAATNEEVARSRATAVRDVLLGLGVAESSIVLDKPLVTTGGGEERESRRVEVSVR
jgi:outer membrane protein OmpA-like peptidoglycan-associated protein